MRTSPLSFLALTSLSGLLFACANPEPVGRTSCQSPELSSAYQAALQWTSGADVQTSSGATPDAVMASDANEASCALAGARQGLYRRRGHHGGHHGGDELRQCREDGRLTGEVAANLYCDLSIELGGLGVDDLLPPGQVSACSLAFEHKCRKLFDSVARSRPDCAPFIGGEFRAAYEVARFNQCLFSIGTEEPEPTCEDGVCECRDQAQCAPTCTGEGCQVTCERTESCEAECGAGCQLSCRDLGTCDANAGEGSDVTCERAAECNLESEGGDVTCRDVGRCDVELKGPGKVTCERASSCEIDCKDCDVTCRGVGLCRVELDEGSVRCDRTGKCDVRCADGRRAKRRWDGSYVCGGQGSCRGWR